MLFESEITWVNSLIHPLLNSLSLRSALLDLLNDPLHKWVINVGNKRRDNPRQANFIPYPAVPLPCEVFVPLKALRVRNQIGIRYDLRDEIFERNPSDLSLEKDG